MVTRWQNSGLTQKAFCTADHIAYHVFHYWYGVYRSNQKATACFVPVKIISPVIAGHITLTGSNGLQLQFAFTDQTVLFIKQLLQS